jgi:hypothetical protein
MSTKTTFKRIALGTVAALGFGMLSVVVAPSANAATSLTSISVGTVSGVRAGGTVTIPVTVNWSATAASDTVTVAAKVVSAPTSGGLANAASVFANAPTSGAGSNASGSEVLYFGTAGGAVTSSSAYAATAAGAVTATSVIGRASTSGATVAAANGTGLALAAADLYTVVAATETSTTFYLTVKPDLVGTYTFLVSASTTSGNASYVAGDLSTLVTLTTTGAPTTATFTNIGGSSATNATGANGALYKVTFKDAAGVATTLTGDEAFTVSASAGFVAKATVSNGIFDTTPPTSSTGTSVSFAAADLYNGVGFFNAKYGTAASTVVLTGTGTGTLSSSVTATASYTTAAAVADAASNTFDGVEDGWSSLTVPSTSTSNSVKLTYTGATTASYGYLTIRDLSGHISGAPSTTTLDYDRAYTRAALAAAAATSLTVAIPHAAGAFQYNVLDSGGATIGDVTAAASSLTAGTLTALPASVRMATGGSVSVSALVEDQFGAAKSNASVTVTVSGRNSAKASQTLVTDANGYVTYSFTDTGSAGTADTITLTASSAATDTVAITYGTATAGSVLVTTPNTLSTGVAEYPTVAEDISAADGAEAGAVTVTALVKDADGNVMAGIPVTWTIAGTGVAITSTTTSGYTSAAGTVTASVYGWVAGSYTVTATAGGKSDDAPVIFAQNTPTEVRSLSATASGNTLTVTAKDRFGNVVANVPVKATRTAGTGNFGGSSSATGTTDETGSASFDVSNGSATVKVTFNDAAASTYGQSDALKGLIDGTTATNVFTAYTAGTAVEAEEGVGASFDAAGVNSVTVEVSASDNAQAAADAAAEATDAANAATDAANAAAEAADAATAAAQDAADAVAALSAQVASLISGLKSQLTALTNLVIKIQKKVKA